MTLKIESGHLVHLIAENYIYNVCLQLITVHINKIIHKNIIILATIK